MKHISVQEADRAAEKVLGRNLLGIWFGRREFHEKPIF